MSRNEAPELELDFTTDDHDDVVAAMAELATTRDGWLNVRPVLEEEELPPPPSILAIFSTRGTVLPIGTWVPGTLDRHGHPAPTSLGIAHPAGRKVAMRLVEAGLRPPADWRGVQDHARRGLVLELPDGTDPETVLTWMLAVMTELSDTPLHGDWRAGVHRT